MNFMNEPIFLDTNVLIYARTQQDPAKHVAARLWIRRSVEAGVVCINRQVLNELTWWVLRREAGRSVKDIRSEIDVLSAWGAAPVSEADVEVAWAIRSAFGYQWYDCLLLAAAQHAECHFFLSEDMTDGVIVGGVRIVNPFAHHPDTFIIAD
jgi:predicted nucleic acid-binding protein